MSIPRRGWKLDLGDQTGAVASSERSARAKAKAGRAKAHASPRQRQDPDAPTWTPGAGAKRIGVEAGTRLATYVARQVHGYSVREAKRLIEAGCVRVDGRLVTFASHQLEFGQIVEIFAELAPQEHTFEARRVLLDGDGLLAYDKPAWLATTPTDATKSWSLLDILKSQFDPLIPVHRIDADTSGVVLFAREEKLARALEERFREHQVHKTYLAIVRGHPREKGEHRSYLIQREKGQGFERWASGKGTDARAAITTWEVVERLGQFGSLVKVQPKTGRHHQIRIHFAEMGHPLYGDRQHGDRRDPVQAPRHMLHAWKLDTTHPVHGFAPIRITAPVPKEFDELAARIRRIRH